MACPGRDEHTWAYTTTIVRYLVASTACVALFMSACSHNDSSSTPATSREEATTQETVASKPPAPSHFRAGSKTYAGATRTVVRSTPQTLVNIPGFGSLTVACTESGIARTVFTVRSPASTVVQVQGTGAIAGIVDPGKTLAAPPGPAGAMQQLWQITPVTEAEVPVATISVASMRAPAAFGGRGCFASAQAITTTATG